MLDLGAISLDRGHASSRCSRQSTARLASTSSTPIVRARRRSLWGWRCRSSCSRRLRSGFRRSRWRRHWRSLSGRLWQAGQPNAPRRSNRAAQQQAIADARRARHELVAAIAANLKERYHDRAIGQHLADAILAQDESGAVRLARHRAEPRGSAQYGHSEHASHASTSLAARSSPTWSTSRRRRRRARRRR